MNANQILAEIQQEIVATKNLIEIIPADRLSFKPHEKAMPLGQLALHVAQILGRNLQFAKEGKVETKVIVLHPDPIDKKEIVDTLEESLKKVTAILQEETTWLNNNWALKRDGVAIAEMPTSSFIRAFVLNHWYHHRGELTTYLRMLDQKIPSVYGPTADVNPFE